MPGPGYWGYYDYSPLIAVKDGIKSKSKKGAIGEKWWSKRFVSLLESFDIGARLGRGALMQEKARSSPSMSRKVWSMHRSREQDRCLTI